MQQLALVHSALPELDCGSLLRLVAPETALQYNTKLIKGEKKNHNL
jgi:hypothetical protein